AWMTGYEYLKFVAESFGMKKDEYSSKIEKLLVTVGLTAAKNKKIGAYSNGMRQRLGIAQAVINDPKVLIMDEPVSALDPIGRKETLQVIEKLKKNMTILFSTHILSDVDKICDDVIIIDKGKLLAFSSLSELKEKHATQILQIEFQSDPEKLVKDLEKEDWVAKVEKAGNNLSLVLKDDEVIQNNLPMKYFSSKGIGIISYTLNLPQVEDLFEELVREDK
ncbi:MAG: ABC transporter ATP-binding protein, partial [Candidatus Berkelbacteria bacterium]